MGEIDAVITIKVPLAADVVVMGLGVKAQRPSRGTGGHRTGSRRGAIHVNQRMENVGGRTYGQRARLCRVIAQDFGQTGSHCPGHDCQKHGVVAGTNISGGNAMFPGVARHGDLPNSTSWK